MSLMRLLIGWLSIARRLYLRISTSTPITRPRPSSSSREAKKTSPPPWAMPDSTITSGRTFQTSSCSMTMSSGSWMIGMPSQVGS